MSTINSTASLVPHIAPPTACILTPFQKYIRHYIHPEYYELGHTNVPNKEHISELFSFDPSLRRIAWLTFIRTDHCIDMLRQVIMCKADITLMTYSWLPDFPGPWPNFNVEHECVNWESIQQWSKSRAIDVFNPKYLQHPTLGQWVHRLSL